MEPLPSSSLAYSSSSLQIKDVRSLAMEQTVEVKTEPTPLPVTTDTALASTSSLPQQIMISNVRSLASPLPLKTEHDPVTETSVLSVIYLHPSEDKPRCVKAFNWSFSPAIKPEPVIKTEPKIELVPSPVTSIVHHAISNVQAKGQSKRKAKSTNFICKVCGKGFRNKSICNRHQRIHGKGLSSSNIGTKELPDESQVVASSSSAQPSTSAQASGKKKQKKAKLLNSPASPPSTFLINMQRLLLASDVIEQGGKTGASKAQANQKKGKSKTKRGSSASQGEASSPKTSKQVHVSDSSFVCGLCNKSFSRNFHLKTHLRTHTGERPYQCHLCKNTFITSGHLTSHLRVHSGEKPHICAQCGRAFAERNNLVRHERTHTDEKPFQCSLCDKRLRTSGDLNIHMRVHSEHRPYQCKQCNKAFKTLTNLRVHERTHLGLKPYVCSVCEKSFTTNGGLKKHQGTHTRSLSSDVT